MRRVFILAERIGAAVSDKIIAVTHTIIRKALDARVGTKEKFVMVRSGFETSQFVQQDENVQRIRKELGIKNGDMVVGKIARFSILKGHQYVIDAIPKVVEQVPNVKFLFVGSGELEGQFKEQVKREGVEEHVIFAGLTNQERIPLIISAMDVLVHTSLLEGLARVLPQALAAKKPVVSFDIDGAHEVVIDERTGYLVEPGNCEQLTTAIVTLLNDKNKSRIFGENGSNIVHHEWSKDAMVHAIDDVYQQMLKEPS